MEVRIRSKSLDNKQFMASLTGKKHLIRSLTCKINRQPVTILKTLIVITWNEGLIFKERVEIIDYKNIIKFFSSYDIFRVSSHEDFEFIILIHDILPTEIPLIY